MKAAIVTIGDEILIGQIVDTNSSYIAKALDKIGIATHEMLSISDDKKHILNTLNLLQNKVDVVIVTGGLGPTKDDITKKTFCDYFEDNLIENEEVLFHVKSIIEGIYKRPITQINRDQALVPTKAKVLFNKVGTAPGMWMEKENTVFISLPGVPYEMKYLVDNEVITNLVQKFERPYIVHQTIMTYGRGESMIAEQIEEWEDNLPEFIKLAYLPSPGKVRLRLTARGTNEELLRNEINNQVQKLDLLIHDIIVGYNEDEPIEVVLGRLLTDKNLTIATAESCTGGKIAATLSAVPGASNYFKGSVVSYATQAKTNVLGVANELIIEHGVVSAEVAVEMAKSVQKIMASDFAIATTGNAGPTKGDDIAELGTVFIAIATKSEVYVEEFNFGQPREKVIDRAVSKALELIYKEILKK
ncbi:MULTISPECIES: CinA family nicotinamide mononucleotide deamidase-related protein [unclassified Flavobacterium]|uniref:CinA family nicotinamide mononucleotide deamidase-related protein n=1 Tax=unclassified Flavobacterium TaxID=196869 RepID=UPI001290E057|nr:MULTISPECIES: CinA family nicotinamide mononucleotide deamidase-related protein [unclassified Flavobacterium]MQP53400.1 CinA family nicotinamide mononucleotide deamidase-related protein [Flavobacterium sp. LMO9]MQP63446.1 CinA family nicotinamide mononucleotide deamidase-related protein [Flavobacterium sp. LMO6]